MGERGLANVQIQPTQAALKEYVQIEKKLKFYERFYELDFMTKFKILNVTRKLKPKRSQ